MAFKAYYPVALELFTRLHQASTLRFLQSYSTLTEAAAASQIDIEKVLKAAGHHRTTRFVPKIYQTLQQSHLQADAVTILTKAPLMLVLVAQ